MATSTAEQGKIDPNNSWERMWAGGLKPGQAFDRQRPAAPLLQILQKESKDVQGKRWVVPGCGRGYDLIALARAGAASATGLELSATAVQACKEQLQQDLTAEEAGRAEILQADFTQFVDPSGQGYDGGYDYTFYCALEPSMRGAWAQGWARLMRPGGLLVTLMFPIDPTRRLEDAQGAPYPVKKEEYHELLEAVGFKAVSVERVPDEDSFPDRKGKEWIGLWRRV